MAVSVDQEEGETLIELIVAIAIMGLAGVAIMTGFQFSIVSSDLGRKQANGDSLVRSLGEVIQNTVAAGTTPYVGCAGNASYLTAAVLTQAGVSGSSYAATQSAASAWTGTKWVGPTEQPPSACTGDNGVQKVLLTVTSPDPSSSAHQATETLTVIIRKPCNGSLPTPC